MIPVEDLLKVFPDVSKFAVQVAVNIYFGPVYRVDVIFDVSVNVERAASEITGASVDTFLDAQSRLNDANMVMVCELSLLESLHVIRKAYMMFRKNTS